MSELSPAERAELEALRALKAAREREELENLRAQLMDEHEVDLDIYRDANLDSDAVQSSRSDAYGCGDDEFGHVDEDVASIDRVTHSNVVAKEQTFLNADEVCEEVHHTARQGVACRQNGAAAQSSKDTAHHLTAYSDDDGVKRVQEQAHSLGASQGRENVSQTSSDGVAGVASTARVQESAHGQMCETKRSTKKDRELLPLEPMPFKQKIIIVVIIILFLTAVYYIFTNQGGL